MLSSNKETSFWIISLSYVGAFVGAGFISGQELAQFFIRFGLLGIVGWFIVVLVISMGGGFVLKNLAMEKPESFDDLVKRYFGNFAAKAVNLIINGYLFGGLIIMLSGSSNLLAELIHVPMYISSGLILGVIFFTIIGQGKRLLKVNTFLVPILIISTLFISIKLIFINSGPINPLKEFSIKNPSLLLANWWISVLLYIGYNAIGAIVALVNISKEVTPNSGKKGGILGGIIIAIMGSLLMLALWSTYPVWQQADLPIVEIIKQYFAWFYPIFIPSMIIAMFTVATAYALGVSNFIYEKNNKISLKLYCFLILILAYPISLLGFSKLLGIIYPFFGICATLILVYLILNKIWLKLTYTKF